MRANAVQPGKAGSIHLEEVAKLSLGQLPDRRGGLDLIKPQAPVPGWLDPLGTTPNHGLEHDDELSPALTEDAAAIRVFVEGKGSN
jgi:hypothetical protein